MRIRDIFESFGEIDIVRQRLRDLKTATATFSFMSGTVTISFEMTDDDGIPQPGKITYYAQPHGHVSSKDVLKRKLAAAARSQNQGQAVSGTDAQVRKCSRIGPNAIRILTNPQEMRMIGLLWNGYTYGYPKTATKAA